MTASISKKDKLCNISLKLKIFFESKFFVIALGFLTIISWLWANFVKIPIAFSTPYIFIAIIVWLMCLTHSKPCASMAMFMLFFAGNSSMKFPYTTADVILLGIIGIPTLSLVAYKFSRCKIRSNLKFLYQDKTAFWLTILVGIMYLSTIKSPVKGFTMLYSFVMMLTLFLYLLSVLVIEKTDKNKQLMSIGLITFMYVIIIEFAISAAIDYFRYDGNLEQFWISLQTKKVNIGWSLGNHFAVIINIAIAMCIYEIIKHKNLAYRIFLVLSIIFGIVAEVFTFSRGAYFGFAAMIGTLFLALLIMVKNKKFIIWSILIAIFCAASLLIIFWKLGLLSQILEILSDRGMSVNGRDGLWELSINLFKDNWLLGTGWGSSYYYIEQILNRPEYNYHNYILQSSTCGILGIISFVLFVVFLIKKLFKPDLFSIMIFSITVMFLVHGFVDTLFLNPILMSILLMLAGMVTNNKRTETINQTKEIELVE